MGNMVEVVVSSSSIMMDRLFTYEVEKDDEENIRIGQRVMVPFGKGNKPIEGYVFEVASEKDTDFNVKKVIEIADRVPLMNGRQIELIKWMREQYICTYMDCINAVCPKGIGIENYKAVTIKKFPDAALDEMEEKILKEVERHPNMPVEKLYNTFEDSKKCIDELVKTGILEIAWDYKKTENKKYVETVKACIETESADSIIEGLRKKRAFKQADVINFLRYNDGCLKKDLIRITGSSSAVIRSLQQKGLIEIQIEEDLREPEEEMLCEEDMFLNPDQEKAVRQIEHVLSQDLPKPIVLHGVTGSGKTRVYMEAIAKALALGKECIMLVPEISLTPQTVALLRARFGTKIAVMHSGLSQGEKYDQWRKMKSGDAKICIGARSAIFSPFENIGLIIVDEFHESSYKSDMAPKYDTIELAKKICMQHGAGLVLGSATPPVKEYYRCKNEEYDIIRLENRANSKKLPVIELIDMKNEIPYSRAGIFSRRFIELLGNTLDKKEQAIIFLNRRGYSSFVHCRQCGFVLKCSRCDISLTYHKDIDRAKCHYCGHSQKVPDECPQCKSGALESAGMGTQMVVDEIGRLFPKSRILRMDRDTTSKKGSHSRLLQKFRKKEADILIGTQMISKGHDFPSVTFVGVVSADELLNYPDYKSAERTFQLITQVAGRAGRADLAGVVAVQAYDIFHYSVQHAKDYDYEGFYEKEIKIRETFSYEPFGNMISIVVSGKDRNRVMNNIYKIHEGITYVLAKRGFLDFSFMMGPAECPVPFINMNHRWQMVIRDDVADIDFLRKIVRFVCVTKRPDILDRDVNVSIDINPTNIM